MPRTTSRSRTEPFGSSGRARGRTALSDFMSVSGSFSSARGHVDLRLLSDDGRSRRFLIRPGRRSRCGPRSPGEPPGRPAVGERSSPSASLTSPAASHGLSSTSRSFGRPRVGDPGDRSALRQPIQRRARHLSVADFDGSGSGLSRARGVGHGLDLPAQPPAHELEGRHIADRQQKTREQRDRHDPDQEVRKGEAKGEPPHDGLKGQPDGAETEHPPRRHARRATRGHPGIPAGRRRRRR